MFEFFNKYSVRPLNPIENAIFSKIEKFTNKSVVAVGDEGLECFHNSVMK